jgi:hemolysin-activating ACP:hemolysin acyltransferase
MSRAKQDTARDPSATRHPLQILRPGNPATALGLAVSYLMTKPAFASLKFGDWSRLLVGQINRGHFCFAVDANREIRGFMGWALADSAHAEAWLAGRSGLTYEHSKAGDCMVINGWAAESTAATRFLMQEARRIADGKTAVYFKRHYDDGTSRAVRVPVNGFVGSHVERSRQANIVPARASAAH